MSKENNELTNVQQIVQHVLNKEPSKLKNVVNKEISTRVMGHIEAKRSDVGSTLFGK